MARLSTHAAAASTALGLGLAMALTASAQTIVDDSAATLDPALVTSIQRLVTRDFASPGAAQFRKLHLSKARNGRGYCGEVATATGADFVPFHAIIEEAGPSSLLLLSDNATSGEGPDRDTAIRLLTNFGCLE